MHLAARSGALILLVAGLVLGSCANNKAQVQTQESDEFTGTSLRSDLAGTEWDIVEMTGFPDDNVADGTFTFSDEQFEDDDERFGHYDGVNWSSSSIKWNESGFTVTAMGDTTDMGPPPGENRYLQSFFETAARIKITQNRDGTISLTRGEMTVTAERGQVDLAAELRSSLTGKQWRIVSMTGFPDDNVVAGDFAFTNEHFRYYDGSYRLFIEWRESGFAAKAIDRTGDIDREPDSGLYLGMLVPLWTHVEIVHNADSSLTLTQGGLTVVAEPA